MSTSVIEPGTRLAGRYRLEEKVPAVHGGSSDASGSTLWKAIDEILARAVAVRTFEPDFPRAAEVVTAARTASRLTDPRLTQVFDADDTGELAYVVSEWVSGESLEDMITSDGPLEFGRATRFVSEAAEALTAAHSAGMAHLCLTPGNLVWTSGGTVKLTGLGVDQVLCGVNSAEPARIDALGLGQMLYAALTGHWPGSADETSLPLAPEENGEFADPGTLREGLSDDVASIVSRAMELGSPAEPLTTPAEVAAALTKVPRTPLPLFAGLQTGPPPSIINRPPRNTGPQRTVPTPRSVPSTQRTSVLPEVAPPASVKPVNRPMVAAVAVGAALAVGIAAYAMSGDPDKPSGSSPGTVTSSSPVSPSSGNKLDISSAQGFFEENPAQAGHPDDKVGATAGLIKDGKPGTYFATTQYKGTYATQFGNYLKGVGVVLDMGTAKKINKINLTAPAGSAGASVEVYVGDVTDRGTLQRAGHGTLSTSLDLALNGASGQYVILWFPKGPPGGRLQVGEATVYGTG